jgi:hypothetical protein
MPASLPRSEAAPPAAAPAPPAVTGGGWSVSREATITIRTDEGDTVTLTLGSRLAALGVDVAGGDQDASLRALTLDRKASLEVEGDLSRRERRDVMKAIRHALNAVRSFFRGQLFAAVRQAFAPRLPESLASVTIEASRTVTATGFSAAAPEAAPEPYAPGERTPVA